MLPEQADETTIQAMQELIEDPDLEVLARETDRFNIFEAIEAVRRELNHSAFLAYLLDPNQNHGLGDTFTRRFLQSAVAGAQPSSLSIHPIDLALWDFDQIEVRREWRNIDILMIDEAHEFVVIIENKIFSGEHSNQLSHYWKIVRAEFPKYRVLGVLLSPEGLAPSEEQYLSISYQEVQTILEKLLAAQSTRIHPDVRILIDHYVQMLRRHIMAEPEIATLCRRIYRKHKRVLDLIYEYRTDFQDTLRAHIEEKINANPDLVLEHSVKNEIRFTPVAWDTPRLCQGEGWLPSNRMLVFYIDNRPDRVRINLTIGPGPQATRQALLDMVKQNEPPFKSAYKNLNQKWNNVYIKPVLTKKDLESLEEEQLIEKFDDAWEKFIHQVLPEMLAVVQKQAWIFGKPVEPEGEGR